MTKEQEQDTIFKSIEALVNNLTNAFNTVKYNDKAIQDIIDLSIQYFTKTKDFDKVFMLFYNVKIGKQSFYNKFLRGFFEYNGVKIEYNIYKKKVFYFGKISEVKMTFEEYKELLKNDKEEYIKGLSIQDRLEKRLAFLDKLSKQELDYALKYIKDRQHKTV